MGPPNHICERCGVEWTRGGATAAVDSFLGGLAASEAARHGSASRDDGDSRYSSPATARRFKIPPCLLMGSIKRTCEPLGFTRGIRRQAGECRLLPAA